VCRDYGNCMSDDFAKDRFPEFFAQYPSKSYRILSFLEFRFNQTFSDRLDVSFNDFMIPESEHLDFNQESLSLLQSGTKYQATCVSMLYLRSMTNKEEADIVSYLS